MISNDGRVNPGGETETTLISVLRDPSLADRYKQDKNIKPASAVARAVPPLVLGAGAALQWWSEQNTETRERLLHKQDDVDEEERAKRKEQEKNDAEDRRKDKCYEAYEENMRRCTGAYPKIGPDGYRACGETASSIHSMCVTNKPREWWPELQDKVYD